MEYRSLRAAGDTKTEVAGKMRALHINLGERFPIVEWEMFHVYDYYHSMAKIFEHGRDALIELDPEPLAVTTRFGAPDDLPLERRPFLVEAHRVDVWGKVVPEDDVDPANGAETVAEVPA
ncbi:MAG TPA: hypothetical protein VD948_02975 [Rhodothermales bacterium]|nr:hypothetical protein [Rhodothermales bacterium]